MSSVGVVGTDVESSDMEVVVELGVPGASEGVTGSEGGRLIKVGGPVDMASSVRASICVGVYEKEPQVGNLVLCRSRSVLF